MNSFSTQFDIDGQMVGVGCPVYIIAEAGVAHFGSEEQAYQLVDLAKGAGANAVKFQVFDIDAMISKESFEWKQRLGPRQLPYQAFERIQKYCYKKGITFFATAHDEPSLEFLESINVPVYKVGSGEVGNWPYLKRVADIGKPLIFSTGMYHQNQISEALDIIHSSGNVNVAALHCVTDYPTSANDASLGNIKLIRDSFDVVAGYSDHTMGYHLPLVSVALGASIIEKHITLDYNIPNAQDWKVSCGPDNFEQFIQQVRDVELAMLTRMTGPTKNEKNSMYWAGKSLVAARNIPQGNIITESDIVAKRPGSGISPSRTGEVLGKKTKVAIDFDDIIKLENFD